MWYTEGYMYSFSRNGVPKKESVLRKTFSRMNVKDTSPINGSGVYLVEFICYIIPYAQ